MTKILIFQCREYGFEAWSWTMIWSKKKITGFAVGWLSTNEKAWRRLGVCCFCLLLYSWDVAKPGPLLFVMLFVKFSSIAQSYLTLCDPMDCSTPGFPVHHQCPVAQTHALQVGDAIQPSHSLSSPSPPAFNLSQHQGLFQ